jgi:hypothetical protein
MREGGKITLAPGNDQRPFLLLPQLCRACGLYHENMKAKFSFLFVPTLAAVLQLAPTAVAQGPADKPFKQLQERRARWASLSEEERAKLKAAHQKAMEDPAVRAAHDKLKQARREFREVMRPAMLKADPSLQPIFDKLRAERPGRN